MDLGEKIRQLDEQVASAVRRALDDVRNELRSGLDQAIDDLRGKLAEVSPDLPESFFTEEALRQLAEETAPTSDDALAQARAEGEAAARDGLGSDLREALAAIDRARSQNDVLQALVDQSSRFASRAAVLLLRPEGLVGWVAHGFEGAPDDIRSASVAAQAEDWSTAAGGEGPRRLPASRCAQLVSQLDSPVPAEGVAIPVLLRDRVSAVFYADRAGSGDHFDVAALQALVYTTALALETLTFRQREATATLEAVTGEVAPAPEPEAEAEEPPFELPAEDEAIELAEEAPPAVEEDLPEPAAAEEVEEMAAEEIEVEELEVEGFETPETEAPPQIEAPPETEAPDIEATETEAAPNEDEVEVIELPEDVGEMELETEEDETASWRAWKPPTAEAEPEVAEDSRLEVIDLDAETAAEETVPPAEPMAEMELPAEMEPEAPSTAPAPPPAEATVEEEAVAEAAAGAETRTIAGFERDFKLTPPVEPPAASMAEMAEEEVELEVEELELDAEALEDLPELEPGPAELAGDEPVLELDLDEELPEAGEEPISWRTEEGAEAPEAGGAPMTEAVEPAEAAPPTEPPAPMAAEAEAPVEEIEESPATAPEVPEVPEQPATTTTSAFAGAAPDLPSGGPIEPPTDIQGPGLAFSDKGPEAGATGDDAAHQEARRLARLLVSEIQLYNQDEVEEGRRNGDIYERLKDDIDRSRQLYEERVAPDLRESTDYFYQELVRQLGAGDAKALGI